jgi:sugar diacid utilization regulator
MTEPNRSSLRRVLDDLGRTVLEVVAGPAGAAAVDGPRGRVGGVVILDPLDPPLLPPRAIVLAVGAAGARALADLLETLSGQDVAALVVRAPVDVDDRVRAAADIAGIVLLGLTRGAAWTQVVAMLRSLTAEDVVPVTSGDTIGGTPSGDLFALANAVSALIDAPVTIEDRSSRVLAFSGRQDEADESRIETVLGRQVPEHYTRLLEDQGVFHRLYRTQGPVFVDQRELATPKIGVSRTAVAVRAGDEILGSMWAVTAAPLSPDRAAAFADSTRLVALHLLRQRAGADVERRLRADLLATVLRGERGADEAAARLGLATGPAVVLALAALDESDVDADLEASRQRLADAFAVHLSAVHSRAVAALVGGVAYGILPVAGAGGAADGADAVRIAQEFLDRSERRVPAVVGVGRVGAGGPGLARSRSDADRVLRVLRRDGAARRVATVAEVHVQALMQELSDLSASHELADLGPVSALRAYDADHAGELERTLRVWLDELGDVTAAAVALRVHPNTLRYRLRRIADVSGLDLGDPQSRFAATIALRLAEVAGRDPG